MNVNVQSIHFDADSKLVDFIQDKLDKLSQFHDNIISGDVFLRLSHDREGRENKLVEIRLNAPGMRSLLQQTCKNLRGGRGDNRGGPAQPGGAKQTVVAEDSITS